MAGLHPIPASTNQSTSIGATDAKLAPLSPMPRWPWIAALVLLALLVASQFVIPPLVEHHIEGRLTEGGGSADVSVSAFPAARLLFGDGSRITVHGEGLDLGLPEPGGSVFDELDGFDRVDVSLHDLRAGPFSVSSFDLTRSGSSATYHVVAQSSTTPDELAQYGAARLGIPGGPLLGLAAGNALGGHAIPVALDMQLRSEGGRLVVVSGGGTVAGYPTGPLAELITSAIAVRL
jgi:hypothetical protein